VVCTETWPSRTEFVPARPGAVAEAGTRSSKVMRREFYDSNLACVLLDDMPHPFSVHFGAPNRFRPTDANEITSP